MINPLYLRTFICLVNERHFTRTAERLYMTQPGVSQHIRKLEEELGTSLLHRYGKQFELTEAGERLYAYGQRQQQAEAELREQLTGDTPYAGECRIACSGSMALQLYPRLLELQRQYPELSFTLEAAPVEGIIERVLERKTDLGLITRPLKEARLEQRELGSEPLCLVLPKGERADWNSLQRLGFINHPDGAQYANELLSQNFTQDFAGIDTLNQKGFINQIGQILLPVARGLGFTVVPRSCLEAFAEQSRVYAAPLKQPVNDPLYLIQKKNRPLPQRYGPIRELLQQLWSGQAL